MSYRTIPQSQGSGPSYLRRGDLFQLISGCLRSLFGTAMVWLVILAVELWRRCIMGTRIRLVFLPGRVCLILVASSQTSTKAKQEVCLAHLSHSALHNLSWTSRERMRTQENGSQSVYLSMSTVLNRT